MKTLQKISKKAGLLLFVIIFFSCNKDETKFDVSSKLEELAPTIQLDEFEVDEGEIGISISARDIAKKGYKPSVAEISVNSSPMESIAFDEFNNLANLSFKNKDLTGSAQNELKEGVPVDVIVKDEKGNVLASESFSKLSFQSSPSEQEVNADGLPDLFAKITLREGILHYMQIVDSDNSIIGAPTSELYPNLTDKDTPFLMKDIEDLNYNEEYPEKYTTFMFNEIVNEPGVFNISVHNGNDIHYLYVDVSGSDLGRVNIQSKLNLNINGSNTDASVRDNYKFKIEKKTAGLYTITSIFTGNKIVLGNSNRLFSGDETINDSPAYFRILVFDIDWDIVAIESKFLKPIMPPSSSNSAYNSTLRNCSSGSLTQNIGETTTITSTQTASWEETMSIATTNEAGVSVTISHEAETKFFGVGGKTSGSITGDYKYTHKKTETSTKSGSITKEKSVQVSVSRDVGVPPGTAISVADIYQQYENIKVPFVQRFRIFGNYQKTGIALSGQEILTQFTFNKFTGVVTNVQADYIEVTVRGATEIDRLIETSTETRDIPDACN